MRCKNCGWSNESNAKKCIKCNAPLCGSMIASEQPIEQIPIEADKEDDLRDTYREPSSGGKTPDYDENHILCPRCGYNVAPNMASCPICNTRIHNSNSRMPNSDNASNHNRQGTINPWGRGMNLNGTSFCQLEPIPWEGENISYQPQSYSGQQIVLNRSNTDPNNHSITSQQQAILTCDDGEWFIENRSAHKSTFIQVNGKMPLKDGDIILLGNRMFVFRKH